MTEDDRGAERTDAMHVGHGGARGAHRFGDALVDRHELVVEAAEITEDVERDALAFGADRLDGGDPAEELARPGGGERTSSTAGGELAQQDVQPGTPPGFAGR